MKTNTMQTRLAELFAGGRIKHGGYYDLMPSDCSGDGYDIALKSRPDESGDYIIDGHLMRVLCTVRVGSERWRDGIPAGYRLACDPSVPYTLRPGERAVVVHRKGTNIGRSGYMHRVLASIAIIKQDGRNLYRGHTPYWIETTNTYAAHYKSGLNKSDAAAYAGEVARLEAIAAAINKQGGAV